MFSKTIDALAARLQDLEGKRAAAVGAGADRGRVSRGARAVLDSLDAGADLPPLPGDFRGRRGAPRALAANRLTAPKASAVRGGSRVRKAPMAPRFY